MAVVDGVELTPEQQRELKQLQRDIRQGDAIISALRAAFFVVKWIVFIAGGTVIARLTWIAMERLGY